MGQQELFYLPVLSGKNGFLPMEVNGEPDRLNLAWWSRGNPLFKHDGALMSAFYGINKPDMRTELEMRDDVTFFGDSGGFQIYSMGQREGNTEKFRKIVEKLNPVKVIEWQQSCCNIGMTLDHPLKERPYTEDLFQKRVMASKKNGDIMREHHYNKDFKLYDVIHGKDPQDMLRWKEITERDHIFDGYSINTTSKSNAAMACAFAMENIESGRGFHALGTSGGNQLIILAHANRYMKTRIYYDSSSFSFGGKSRRYYLPSDFGGKGLFFGNIKEGVEFDRIDKIFCPCPVCQSLDSVKDLWSAQTKGEKPLVMAGVYISAHNLFWTKHFSDMLDQISKNEECWNDFIKRNATDETKKYIQFIDDVADVGLEKAYPKYFSASENLKSWF